MNMNAVNEGPEASAFLKGYREGLAQAGGYRIEAVLTEPYFFYTLGLARYVGHEVGLVAEQPLEARRFLSLTAGLLQRGEPLAPCWCFDWASPDVIAQHLRLYCAMYPTQVPPLAQLIPLSDEQSSFGVKPRLLTNLFS